LPFTFYPKLKTEFFLIAEALDNKATYSVVIEGVAEKKVFYYRRKAVIQVEIEKGTFQSPQMK
jgi:hypothetical protein